MINILQYSFSAESFDSKFISIEGLIIFAVFIILVGSVMMKPNKTESKDSNKNISSSFTIDDDGTIIRDFSENSSCNHKAANYCYKCGSGLDVKSNFCPNCGAPQS